MNQEAIDRIAATQGPGRGHSNRKTSPAQLRHMRMRAREVGIDVGPACCAKHSAQWIDGLDALEADGHYSGDPP